MPSQEKRERLDEKRVDRALALLNGPLFWRFVHALDVIGWKIVPQDSERGDMRLPTPINSKRKRWPTWIEDFRKRPPKLRVIDGGKHDDQA